MAGFAGTSLSRKGWAELIAEEAHQLGYKLTPKQLAEALGVREAEGYTDEGAHIGPWEEEESFGPPKARLDYRTSTRAALERWHADGKSWWPGWGDWEKGEEEGAGPTRYARHLALATAVLGQHAVKTSPAAAARRKRRSPSTAAAAAPTSSGGDGGGGIAGDFMHFGLVALLVAGGVGLMGLGTTRVFHSGGAA